MLLDSLVPQAETRTSAVYQDQHGRKWDVTLDTRTRPRPSPVCEPSPLDWKYRVPKYLRPDVSWMKFNDQSRTIFIDYELALSKLGERHKYFNRERQRIAGEMYGDAAHEYCDQVEVDETTGKRSVKRGKWNTTLRRRCGPIPAPLEFIRAMRAGNTWALGFSTVVPEWAVPLIPYELESLLLDDDGIDYSDTPKAVEKKKEEEPRLTWNEFRSLKKKEGMEMEDISEAWENYKNEALEEVPI